MFSSNSHKRKIDDGGEKRTLHNFNVDFWEEWRLYFICVVACIISVLARRWKTSSTKKTFQAKEHERSLDYYFNNKTDSVRRLEKLEEQILGLEKRLFLICSSAEKALGEFMVNCESSQLEALDSLDVIEKQDKKTFSDCCPRNQDSCRSDACDNTDKHGINPVEVSKDHDSVARDSICGNTSDVTVVENGNSNSEDGDGFYSYDKFRNFVAKSLETTHQIDTVSNKSPKKVKVPDDLKEISLWVDLKDKHFYYELQRFNRKSIKIPVKKQPKGKPVVEFDVLSTIPSAANLECLPSSIAQRQKQREELKQDVNDELDVKNANTSVLTKSKQSRTKIPKS